jgi:hypothetical protein
VTNARVLPWRQAWSFRGENRGILLAVWWNALLLVAGLAALPFDHRRILGLNPWIKPMKFELSIILFLLTVALLLTILAESGRWRRLRAWMSWGFGICMTVEISIIAMQSARGVRSHMNYATVFDSVAFAIMGRFIAINTVLLTIHLLLFCITRVDRPRAEIWGIRLGLAMILAGSFEGVYMVIHGAHTVGAGDGGPGLPFVNWSTQYGDLRVAHFFALHALQLLWFVGWWLGRTRIPQAATVAFTWIVALIYAGGVWALFAQAMAARPITLMH